MGNITWCISVFYLDLSLGVFERKITTGIFTCNKGVARRWYLYICRDLAIGPDNI